MVHLLWEGRLQADRLGGQALKELTPPLLGNSDAATAQTGTQEPEIKKTSSRGKATGKVLEYAVCTSAVTFLADRTPWDWPGLPRRGVEGTSELQNPQSLALQEAGHKHKPELLSWARGESCWSRQPREGSVGCRTPAGGKRSALDSAASPNPLATQGPVLWDFTVPPVRGPVTPAVAA